MVDLIEDVAKLRAALLSGAWRPSPAALHAAELCQAEPMTSESIRSVLQGHHAGELEALLRHVVAVLDLPDLHDSGSRDRLLSNLADLLQAVTRP